MEENLSQPQVPVPPIEPPVEQPIPKRFPLKWLIIIALLAGIVLTSAYLIFKSQSAKQIPVQAPTQTSQPSPSSISDPTANWKTYTNKKDEIILRYPEEWRLTIKENNYTGYDEITVAHQLDKTTESFEEQFYIYPIRDNGKPQFTNWQPNTQRSIGGMECKGEDIEGSQQIPPSRYYECIVKNTNFGISLISVKGNYSTLDQILSTFKFTDQINAEGAFCGGIANIQCTSGQTCKLDGSYPDAGGKCVKE